MSASDQDLAGLPEDVRDAVIALDETTATVFTNSGLNWYATIRAELLRQAREIADLRVSIVGLGAMRKNIEAELAAIKATPTGTVLDWALRRAEKAEAELAALKLKIADDYERGRQDGINFGPSVREQIDIARDLDHE